MTIPSQDIVLHLTNDGVVSAGWSIFFSRWPSSPDQCIVVNDTGGFDPNPKFMLDFETVQVLVRGELNGYIAAYDKATDIKRSLLGLTGVTLNGVLYIGIWMQSDIVAIGYDEEGRPRLSTNWRLTREAPAAGNRVSL